MIQRLLIIAALPGIKQDPDFDHTLWLKSAASDRYSFNHRMDRFHRDIHHTFHDSEREAKRLGPGIQGMSLRPFSSSSSSSGSGSGGGFSSGGEGGFGGGGGTFR